MEVVDGKMIRSRRNSFEPTHTRSVRATTDFWLRVLYQSEKENLSTNAFIVKVLDDYCTVKENETTDNNRS